MLFISTVLVLCIQVGSPPRFEGFWHLCIVIAYVFSLLFQILRTWSMGTTLQVHQNLTWLPTRKCARNTVPLSVPLRRTSRTLWTH